MLTQQLYFYESLDNAAIILIRWVKISQFKEEAGWDLKNSECANATYLWV
jgi:hypothetical protein